MRAVRLCAVALWLGVSPAFAQSEHLTEPPIPGASPDANAPRPMNGKVPAKAAT